MGPVPAQGNNHYYPLGTVITVFNIFPKSFIKNLVLCNCGLIIAMIAYDLLILLVPLIRITFLTAIITLLIVNIVILGLKYIHLHLS